MATNRRKAGNSDSNYAGAPGVISVTEIYHVEEAKLHLRWTDSAYRAARRRGLAVIQDGKRVYITGLAIQRYFETTSATPSDAPPLPASAG